MARARHGCASATEAAGHVLAPRLTIYPEFVRDPETWLDPALRTPGARRARTPRDSHATTAWSPGRDDLDAARVAAAPLRAAPRAPAARSARCSPACSPAKRSASTRSSPCSARAAPKSSAVAAVADELRREIVGDEVTFVRNRNINYTNVCTFKCRFCAFSKGPLSLNLRGKPYLLELEEMQRRVVEAVECGATEVCLQGGIHPDFDGDYYVDVARAVKAVAPQIHVHGFTALEVTEGARRLDMPLAEYLMRLQGRRPRDPARAPRPRSSTTRSGRSSAPTR